MTTQKPVVVGVDGCVRNTAAIRYGAHEARRQGRPLLLVHVAPQVVLPGVSSTVPMTTVEFRDIGTGVLRDAVRVARRVLPDRAISTRLLYGSVAAMLTEAARDGSLVVLGDDRTSTLGRPVVGSLVASIAARAPVAVASVPQNWVEDPADRGVRRVVVGIKDYDRVPAELLGAAVTIAGRQRAQVELVHVCDLPAPYLGMVCPLLEISGWQRMIDRRLRGLLAAAGLPADDVDTSAWLGRPAVVLRERSAAADLLLLGRRASGMPGGHLGTTARALLRDSVCPVEVLPVAASVAATAAAPRAARSEARLRMPVGG